MKQVRRLVEQLQPEHYDLTIRIAPDKKSWQGALCLQAKLPKAASQLALHTKELVVERVSVLRNKNCYELDPTTFRYDKTSDETSMALPKRLPAGKIEINIVFSGTISPSLSGIYPCNFIQNGKAKIILATQLESHHAREVFPCIDEPSAKATFELTVISPKGEHVISNTPVAKQSHAGQETTTHFERTPKMSTYLLALIVGDVKSLSTTTKHGVTIRTWATPDKTKHTEFALDTAAKMLDFFNDYFEIPYPLAKCDLLALPDFAASAMENWGAITFRESSLLVDEANTSLPNKQYIAIVIAHELAHQWFGNLVTMEWWTHLWLNEGFASWVEYLAVDEVFPEWQIWEQFVSDDWVRAISLDSLENTHAVEVAVHNPAELPTIFDAISYSKGAALIRMLQSHVGAEQFRQSLVHYLTTHQYANATTADLWKAIGDTTGWPIEDFMAKWTSLPGFPVVQAERTADGITLKQQRFMINPHRHPTSKPWPVPLSASSTEEHFVFEASSGNWSVGLPKSSKLNTGQAGFYVVRYDDAWMEDIRAGIREMAATDRMGLLHDTWLLAKAGYAETVAALHLLDVYNDEQSLVVWDVIAEQLSALRRIMDTDRLTELSRPFVAGLVTSELKRLGWEERSDEPYFDKLLRPLILALASFSKVASVVQEATSRFDHMQKPEDQPPDVRGVVYGTIAREGGVKEYEKLRRFYETTESPQERNTLESVLTSFKQPSIIEENLKLIKSGVVRMQDVPHWIAYSFANRHAKHQTWEWLKENWGWLRQELGGDQTGLANIPKFAARVFATKKFAEEYELFFSTQSLPGLKRTVRQGLEMVEWQTAWRERDEDAVIAYLSKR